MNDLSDKALAYRLGVSQKIAKEIKKIALKGPASHPCFAFHSSAYFESYFFDQKVIFFDIPQTTPSKNQWNTIGNSRQNH